VRFFGELRKNPKGLACFAVIVLLVFTAVFGPALIQHDPTLQVISKRFLPPFYAEGGSLGHPLGADAMGRDILSRVVVSTRTSFSIAIVVIAIIMTVGSLVGLISGCFGGIVDTVLMRIVDFQLSFPFILLALLLLAVFGPGYTTLILALSVAFWVNFARLVRSETLKLREAEFVQAAHSIGVSHFAIIFRHILPNALPSIIVLATLDIAVIIISEAALSFLGLGIQPPTPLVGHDDQRRPQLSLPQLLDGSGSGDRDHSHRRAVAPPNEERGAWPGPPSSATPTGSSPGTARPDVTSTAATAMSSSATSA
jgi:ABC-type dipeptide/oligopeptide/nickel transport system permease subunit